jgi:hypothetical protein
VPTISCIGPYRLFFYSGDRGEPPHIHVERDAATAKYWLHPVTIAHSQGFRAIELRRLRAIIEDNQREFLEAWHEYFGP